MNLALYLLTSGDATASRAIYELAVAKKIGRTFLLEAADDVEYLLAVIPDNADAQEMLRLLQSQL